MRFIISIMFAVITLLAYGGEPVVETDAVAYPEITFPDGSALNLGKIRQGKKYTGEIRFVNTGTAPLVIKRVFSDCGCTVADYPRTPVAPGDTAAIGITYNSSGRGIGIFTRVLRVESNTRTRRNAIYVNGTIKK